VLRNVPFRAVLSAGLIFNLAVGPLALTAQQASADVPSITIRANTRLVVCLLYTSPSPRDLSTSRMPSSA